MEQTSQETKTVTIIVNGQEKQWDMREISFDQVVKLAYPNASTGPNAMFTVSYYRGEESKPQGTLVEGQSVRVKNGMRFDVTPTTKS
jgi:Multiubiquitin